MQSAVSGSRTGVTCTRRLPIRDLKHKIDGVPRLSPALTVLEKSARKRWAKRFMFMKSSTKDKIKGSVREAKGKVKEETGKALGNPNLRDRGTDEKVAGKVQKKVGDVKKVFGK